MSSQLKHCSTCQQDKPTAEFAKNAARYDGLANVCRPCKLEADRVRNAARRDEPVSEDKQCTVSGCSERRKGHGYCNRHLKRFREYGDPLAGGRYEKRSQVQRRPPGLTLEESFRWVMPEEPPRDGTPWLWRGTTDENGYGVIRYGGRNHFAHSVSYQLFVGPIPNGLIIRHRNDTPPDVNPLNLETGTRGDNNRDRSERGRSYTGPRSDRSPLSDTDVRLIRVMYNTMGFSQRVLAKKFGVTQMTISNILNRKTWAHVP